MDFVFIILVALVASALTLYSGFGLGTILLPAFALFFPPEAAVAATAVVHLLSNLLKGGLLGRAANWRVALRFGLPAVPAAVLGAYLLSRLSAEPLFAWSAFGRTLSPTAAGAIIGAMMILFAVLELIPAFQRLAAPPRYAPVGGLVAGFLGGLTGHQGALRSMFLLKMGLSAKQFIATGVLIAIMIDLSRVPTYALSLTDGALDMAGRSGALLLAAVLAAFLGAALGARFVEKTTIGGVRIVVAVFMLTIGVGLLAGVVG